MWKHSPGNGYNAAAMDFWLVTRPKRIKVENDHLLLLCTFNEKIGESRTQAADQLINFTSPENRIQLVTGTQWQMLFSIHTEWKHEIFPYASLCARWMGSKILFLNSSNGFWPHKCAVNSIDTLDSLFPPWTQIQRLLNRFGASRRRPMFLIFLMAENLGRLNQPSVILRVFLRRFIFQKAFKKMCFRQCVLHMPRSTARGETLIFDGNNFQETFWFINVIMWFACVFCHRYAFALYCIHGNLH